jgi:2-aminoadipate transaminase
MHQIEPSFIRTILAAATAPGVLSLAGGIPDRTLFPVEAIAQATAQVLERDGSRALQYAGTAGDGELRAWIASRMTSIHGVPTTPEEIMVTNGSQQGLDIAAKLFADGKVAMEEPGYLGARLAFEALRMPIDPISTNADGPDLDALGRAAQGGTRLFYGMSRYRNPTGECYTAHAATRVADLLHRYDVVMLEDDPYGELTYLSAPPLVAQRAPDRAIYLGSFSKSIAPGLRIGFIRAHRDLLAALEPFKQAADLQSSTFSQAVLRVLLTDGEFDFDCHLSRVRSDYHGRLKALTTALYAEIPGVRIPHIPSGGMFVWARIPTSSDDLFPRAIANGVAFVPGGRFYASAPDTATMRLNFTNLTPDKLVLAVGRIAAAMEFAETVA